MENIGVLIEEEKGVVKTSLFGIISYLRTFNCPVFAFVMTAEKEAVSEELSKWGVDTIVDIVPGEQVTTMNPQMAAKMTVNAMVSLNITRLFGLTSTRGKELLARIAALLDAPLIMDCVHVNLAERTAACTKYSGKTDALVRFSGHHAVFGMRPNHFDPVESKTSPERITFTPDVADDTQIEFNHIAESGETGMDLTEADIIISGGRGLKKKENFSLLFECAGELNAAVGASRVAVDEGWAPYTMQVGQTGVKVNPKVYIACGISGSIQHFAGMKTAGIIIAINEDENAPIISKCDYYIIGDLFEILPLLTRTLKIMKA